MKKTQIIIEKGKDGTYSAYSAFLHSTIIGEGGTAAEAKEDFLNSYEEVKASYEESGEPLPEELADLTFEYRYDISALFDFFDFINVSKFAQAIGIEPSLMRHYRSGDTYISASQRKKIEDGIHSIAAELQQVTL